MLAVSFLTLFLAVWTVLSTWNMNFWPSDTEVYFFDVALKVPKLQYPSQMHDLIDEERVKWLHGKEIFVLAAATLQQLMRDFTTLRPFLMVCILALFSSALLIYLIARRYWGQKAAWVLYFLFVTSFWPYIYVLFTKHQPLGLAFFLLATYLLPGNRPRKGIFYFFSGTCLCASFFSSSVSSLYIPYYATAFFYGQYKAAPSGQRWRESLTSAGFILPGILSVYVYVNFPLLIENLREFLDYVYISGKYNHFYYNQRVLEQWFPAHELNTRGGWVWVFKYFRLIMPVVFPLFLAAIGYLIFVAIREKRMALPVAGFILLAWTAPLMAEIRHVAQYGANYFPSFTAFLTLIGFAVYCLEKRYPEWPLWVKKIFLRSAFVVALLQWGINSYWYFTDIYPSRMVTTILAKKIDKMDIDRFYTYQMHPYRLNLVDNLTNSLFRQKKVRVILIDFLPQAKDGFVLLPPISTDAIYNAAISSYTDFDEDIYLSELLRKGNLKDYAVASYKTLASSRFWPHEEEILSYRYLILGQRDKNFDERGRVWLLDGRKMFADLKKNIPAPELVHLYKDEVSNIGTKSRLYVFKGYEGKIKGGMEVSHLSFRMYKVGNPTDQLVARVYKVGEKQLVWVPVGEHFESRPLDAGAITSSPEGGFATFEFKEPIRFSSGAYFVTIYRTGPWDDENFYRIYNKYIGTSVVSRD